MALWDHIPAEHIIVHPRLVWEDLFANIYVEEMKCSNTTPPYKMTKRGRAPGPWYAARKQATHPPRPHALTQPPLPPSYECIHH